MVDDIIYCKEDIDERKKEIIKVVEEVEGNNHGIVR